ncbi:MAG: YdeI/OmpD-associated family protein [Pyrinomonadaceae bacterium]
MKIKFFKTPSDLRKWLAAHHASESELWVGFYKKDSGKASITWPQSVDEALCFGWIDGIRKNIDEASYKIRFTPRKQRSTWSAVNIKRVGELTEQKLMREAGLKAFAARQENRSGIYSYEQRSPELPAQYAKRLKKNAAAWKFFQAQPPSYRKAVNWWVVSAKQEETRLKRLDELIDDSADGHRITQFTAIKKSKDS